jgi:hypothetical protein
MVRWFALKPFGQKAITTIKIYIQIHLNGERYMSDGHWLNIPHSSGSSFVDPSALDPDVRLVVPPVVGGLKIETYSYDEFRPIFAVRNCTRS